ncbi:unnamed protein product [Owenia fusiformis]|uniref:Uncharacterized protein n=1 Tax=Owenia fusiformis TaxID=6347 RepID=A0A8S4NBI9_OWEFU|nr:unnamed protein product [Owenia fusiformis]
MRLVILDFQTSEGKEREDEINDNLAGIYRAMKKHPSAMANARKTCSIWQAEGNESDHYMINPNSEGTPVIVYCDMSTSPATMVLEHDHMDTKSLVGPRCDFEACVRSGPFSYFSGSKDRLLEIISASRSCQQHVRYDCFNSGMDFTRWTTPDDRTRSYWGGYPKGEYSETRCGCFLTGQCTNGQLCNCNNGINFDNQWHVDEGYIVSETSTTSATELPVMEVAFGRFPLVKGCPTAPRHDNSINDASGLGHVAGDVVNYTCSEGYESEGSNIVSLTCRGDGSWESKTISCQRVNCGDPGTSNNTNRALNGTRYGDTVSYTCTSAYKYESGDRTRTCGANGTWTGQILTCQPGLVAFDARGTGSSYWNRAGAVKFIDDLNIGDAYSRVTGLFTAPFQGLYHFESHLQRYGSYTVYCFIRVNNVRLRVIEVDPYSSYPGRGSASLNVQLNKGDTVYVDNRGTGYHIRFNTFDSSFSGLLIQHGDGNN